MKAFDMGVESDRFRHLVVDCRINKKGYSIFEQNETKKDTLALLLAAKPAFQRIIEASDERQLKISMV